MGKDKLNTFVFTESGKIRFEKSIVETGHVVREKYVQSWHLIHSFLVMLSNGDMAMMVGARDCVPLSPFSKLTATEQKTVDEVNKLNHEQISKLNAKMVTDNQKSIQNQLVQIAVLGVVACFVLVALIAMWNKTGGIKMPWS